MDGRLESEFPTILVFLVGDFSVTGEKAGGEKRRVREEPELGESLPAGKLPPDLLARLLSLCPISDPRVVVGPEIGEDAAVIDLGEKYLVAKTDPVTLVGEDIAWYAVNVNANDVACMGARPLWFLGTLLLPEGKTRAVEVEDIFRKLREACRELNISQVGGHVEVTSGIDRPILVGCMLGESEKGHLLRSSGAQVGDAVLLSKGIPIEATSIIARKKREALLLRYPPELVEKGENYLRVPGISIVKEALLAADHPGVHALHDPTEGGLATGLRELATASGVGLEIEEAAVPFLPEGKEFCAFFGVVFADHDLLYLVELMYSVEPVGVFAGGSGLAAKATRQAHVFDGQLFGF